MQKIKETTYPGLKSVRVYGIILVLILGVLHLSAYFSIRWVETNEIRNELVQWSQTLPATNAAQPTADVHLPQDIFALHVKTLDRTGFYETKTDEDILLLLASKAKNNRISWSFMFIYVSDDKLFMSFILPEYRAREYFQLIVDTEMDLKKLDWVTLESYSDFGQENIDILMKST